MEELTYIGDTSTKFLCCPRRSWLVHWRNSWFLFF